MGSINCSEKQMALALYESRICFADDVAERVTRAYHPDCMLGPVIEDILSHQGTEATAQKLREAPTSVSDFTALTKGLFSSEFLVYFKERCEIFDEVCGSALADAFITQFSHQQWAEIIAENCLDSCLRRVKNKKQRHYLEALQARASALRTFQMEYSSDEPDPSPPITQIHLKGKTVKEAWRDNPTTTRMSSNEALPLRDWTPSIIGDLQVFHGTWAHLNSPIKARDIDRALGSLPTGLARSAGPSHLYPRPRIGISTSFSAMRSFLWSIFMAAVIEDPCGLTPGNRLGQPFQLRGNEYRGVVIIRFHSSQPSPSGLSSYQIPEGKESDWHGAVNAYDNLHSNTFFWRNHARRIHGKSTENFPGIIHGKDLPCIYNAMQGFPCNERLLWQTAWMSEQAVSVLNTRAANVFAISFEVEKPSNASSRKKGKSDFGRKLRHGLKKALSGRDLYKY